MIGLLFFSICADEGSAVSVSPNLAGIDLSVNSGTQHFNLISSFTASYVLRHSNPMESSYFDSATFTIASLLRPWNNDSSLRRSFTGVSRGSSSFSHACRTA